MKRVCVAAPAGDTAGEGHPGSAERGGDAPLAAARKAWLAVAAAGGGLLQVVLAMQLSGLTDFALTRTVLDPVLQLGCWLFCCLPQAAWLELRATLVGRSRRPLLHLVPLLSLAGAPGLLGGLLLLRSAATADAPEQNLALEGAGELCRGRQRAEQAAGWLASGASLAILAATALTLLHLGAPSDPSKAALAPLEAEQRALLRLRQIESAQDYYRRSDWNGDGRLEYAAFIVHLWQTLDAKDRPLPSGLVSRELAFAGAPSRALDGYYFVELNERFDAAAGERWDGDWQFMDHTKEWAVMACPVEPDWAQDDEGSRTDVPRALLVHSSGQLYVHPMDEELMMLYPAPPTAAGWQPIGGLDGLRRAQAEAAQGMAGPSPHSLD